MGTLTSPRRSATILLLSLVCNAASLRVDPQKYVSFLHDVQQYYKSSGVFVLYDDFYEPSDYLDISTETNLGELFRALSSRGISSQALRYSELRNDSSTSTSNNAQTLFVVFLSSSSDYRHFGWATLLHGDMSYHTWLVIFAEAIDAEIDSTCRSPPGNPFNLVFNSRFIVTCHEDERIWKWYSLERNRTEVLQLARWTRKRGISYANGNYYAMRYDLGGEVIRIATNTNLTSSQNGKMSGYLSEILAELKLFMNFRVSLVAEDDAFGTWNPETREWSGLLGLLTERRADLVVAPITISKFRLKHVDFTIPLLLSANRIYARQPGGARVQWSAYFKAYTLASWLLIGLMLVCASIGITLMRVVKGAKTANVVENFMRVWGIYCQQGVPDEFPSSTPLRIAYLTTLLLTLVLWAIYSASITSYLTFLSPSLPFSDTEGFVRDGRYRLIVLQNSSDYHVITSGEDPVLTKLQPLLKSPADLPTNPYSGFLQVCNERHVGFYASDAALKGVSAYLPCELTYIETGQFECLAMAMQKRSPYVTSINYNMRKLEDNGVIKKLRNWYFQKIDAANKQEVGHSAIGLWGVAPLLAILAAGVALSTCALMIERAVCFYYDNGDDDGRRVQMEN